MFVSNPRSEIIECVSKCVLQTQTKSKNGRELKEMEGREKEIEG